MIDHVHVSGVGAFGSFIIRELALRSIPFTWHDPESSVNAWEVSTGAILPESRPGAYRDGYQYWCGLSGALGVLAPHLEPVRPVYGGKHPPARGRGVEFTVYSRDGARSLWADPRPAWQFNVQEFVKATRQRHARLRQVTEPTDTPILRCWGVANRTASYPVWGWVLPVSLTLDHALPIDPRPAFHFQDPQQPGMRYLQPIATVSSWWWAGTARLRQRDPVLTTDRAITLATRFKDAVRDVLGPWITSTTWHDAALGQGWRPEPRTDVQGRPVRQPDPRVPVFVPLPLGGSGIHLGPMVAARVVDALCAPQVTRTPVKPPSVRTPVLR